jgi:CBS domain-containing protein
MDQGTEFVLESELRKIEHLPPFNDMPRARLRELFLRCSIVFFRHGSIIFHPLVGLPQPCFWIVREGRVRAAEFDRSRTGMGIDRRLDVGALFPTELMLGRGGGWRIYTAEQDCYLWRIGEDKIDEWLAEPAVLRWLSLTVYEEQREIREAVTELARARQVTDQALAMPVRSFGVTTVEYVAPGRPIGEVAAVMATRKIGSVLVGSPDAVAGIVTYGDIVARGVAARKTTEAPVAEVMTPEPKMIEDTASVLEAGISMAEGRCRHLLLRSAEGKVVGLVSERDIFRAQLHGVADVFRPIDEAGSVADLVDLASRVREFGERVFRQGMEIGQFTRALSSLNDRIARRVLTLCTEKRHLDVSFCWLAFGSEAREEQGFVTDQDNGIAFAAAVPGEVERVRARLLDFAREVNEALDACGFARCKGNIMAGNPEWCLSLEEWKGRFSSWIRSATPQALLNSMIFFDLRPIYGDGLLAEAMLDHLMDASKNSTLFLHHMAINALHHAAPIGRFRQFATAGGGSGGTIDLKTQGTRLFVDVARIYALANGVRTANTVQRLRVVGQRIKRSLSAIEGDVAAFRLVQTIRMRRQLDSLRDGGDPNRIDPYALDELQQRILRESLRQAASLQERLRLDYRP